MVSSPNPVDIYSSTIKNSATTINLVSSDADYDNLTYTIVSNPSNGSVSLSGNNVTYTPATGYEGSIRSLTMFQMVLLLPQPRL